MTDTPIRPTKPADRDLIIWELHDQGSDTVTRWLQSLLMPYEPTPEDHDVFLGALQLLSYSRISEGDSGDGSRDYGSCLGSCGTDSSMALSKADMTDEEYEKKYQDALNKILAMGKKVGHPERSHDGVRYCRINNFPCTDRLIFKQAYGQLIANPILREREGN